MINEPMADFIWPAYKNDKERIKYLSRKYKNASIYDAFVSEYNFNSSLSEQSRVNVESVPSEPRVGDVLKLTITSIDKNRIIFDTFNMKKEVSSKVNLYKYNFFKQFVPQTPVPCMVVDVDKNKISVDPIIPLMDNWLCNYSGNRLYQRNFNQPRPVIVKNLQLTTGGFLGDVVIQDIVDFIHEDYTIPAFIPGSQIVLNIAENFEEYIGKTVEAFVINHIRKPNGQLSVVCSVKEYLKFQGELEMIKMFNSWCDGTEYWESIAQTIYNGKVTGIINSSKRCGIFVEIPELNITGLINSTPEEIVKYKPHTNISVKINGFDEETYFNQTMKQMQHVEPYIITAGALEKCNLKPILTLA